jgi:hypothetical protein
MRSRFQISVIVVAAFLAIGLATTVTADTIPLQMATTDWGYSGAGFNIANLIDGNTAASNRAWIVVPNQTSDHVAAVETVNNASYDSWEFKIYQNATYDGSGDTPPTAPENYGVKRIRLSYTTDDRSTFADGLQNGGDVSANWYQLTPASASGTSSTATINGDHTIDWTNPGGATPDVKTITVGTHLTGVTGFRLEMFAVNGFCGYANDGNANIQEFSVSGVVTPEPGTIVLLATGLIGLLCYAWKKRK